MTHAGKTKHPARRRTARLSLAERMAVLLTRSHWKDPAKHQVSDPEKLTCAALLRNSRTDILNFARSLKNTVKLHRQAAQAFQWLQEGDKIDGIAFELVCAHLGLEPDAVRGAMLYGLDEATIRVIARSHEKECPFCQGEGK